jgi:putative redox protein
VPTTNTVLATFVDPAAGLAVDGVTGSGFTLSFDTADAGARRSGPSPTETVLATLAACTAIDVAAILRKKRQRATEYRIAVTGEKRDEHPQVYTTIAVEHRVTGEVEPEALRRAVELSATQYCPVSAMLSASVSIEHRYRLWRDGETGDGVSALVTVTGPVGVRPG